MIRWWQRRTLRFRLAVWYAAGGTLLLAVFSATIYFYVSRRLARPLDHQLRLDLADVRKRLQVSAGEGIRWDGREMQASADWDPSDPWFELWDENGRLVRRFWPFSDNRISHVPIAPARGRDTISVFSVGPDLRIRVLSVPSGITGPAEAWMVRVMRMHERAGEPLRALLVIIVFSLPIVVALLVIGGYLITRRWLRPLDQMVAEAKRISADDLSRRLPVVNPHDELGQLASVFNVTLDRLADSFGALDRFVGDASHELRTPLTALRNVGEVGLRRSRTVEEYREIIGSMLEEAQRLQRLVQRLLELAGAEGGGQPAQRLRIRVDEFVAAGAGELGILVEAKGQTLALDLEPCEVLADPILFRQALQNLIDNAIKYSPERSTITVKVRGDVKTCRVEVTDAGPGIGPQHRARLMERFFRPDMSRGRPEGGFGLGLSITKAYMRVLGGTVDYEPAIPSGSTFRLTLPKA